MSEPKSKYEVLKDLLLGDELQKQDQLDGELQQLRQEIKVREKLEQNVEPILSERIMRLKREFPREFGPAMMKALAEQSKENPEEIRDILGPMVTDIVKDYLSNRWYNFRKKLGFSRTERKDPTSLYTDPPAPADAMEENQEEAPQLNDVYVLENERFQILGHQSKYQGHVEEHVQKGLKKMVQDLVHEAVVHQQQSIGWHHYDHYKVYLITFKRISVACTVMGVPSMRYKQELEDQVMEFAKDYLPEMRKEDAAYNQKLAQRFLDNHFQLL